MRGRFPAVQKNKATVLFEKMYREISKAHHKFYSKYQNSYLWSTKQSILDYGFKSEITTEAIAEAFATADSAHEVAAGANRPS